MVTSILAGQGADYDAHQQKKVVDRDLGKGIQVSIVVGGKGCDDGENHYYLKEKGIASAIRLNLPPAYRTRKKGRKKEVWLKLVEAKGKSGIPGRA